VSALKISFGMHFGKSPQHEAPRWGHSFHPSTPIANMATFPQQSAFSCPTTIAPKQTRADRPKAPSKMATRCDPGGLSTENDQPSLYLLVNCRQAGAAVSLPAMERISLSGDARRKSTIVRRYVTISGRNSSVSLEDEFWEALKEIADIRGTTRATIVSTIASAGRPGSLSSAVRAFVLEHYRSKIDSVAARH
jgi:predicted DNA-binding ribbon-helix-helix protein